MSAIAVGEITIIDLHDEDVHIGTTAPVDPKDGRLWLDTSTVPNVMKRWDAATQKWIKASPTSAGDIGAETPSGAQDKADGAEDAAKTYAGNILKDLADGDYVGGTFIDGKSVITPTVVGLQGTFAELMAGNPFGARLGLGEDAGTPFLEAYDGWMGLRVRLLEDRLNFNLGDALLGGSITTNYELDEDGAGDVDLLFEERSQEEWNYGTHVGTAIGTGYLPGDTVLVLEDGCPDGYHISQVIYLGGIQQLYSCQISWDAGVGDETDLKVYTAITTSGYRPPAPDSAAWVEPTNGGTVPGLSANADLTGKYLWIKKVLHSDSPYVVTPVLNWLEVTIEGWSNGSYTFGMDVIAESRLMLRAPEKASLESKAASVVCDDDTVWLKGILALTDVKGFGFHGTDILLLGGADIYYGDSKTRLMDQGENSNGSWVRFSNGLQVCWIPSITLAYVHTGLLRASWTYPAEFKSGSTPAGFANPREYAPVVSARTAGTVVSCGASSCSVSASAPAGTFGEDDTWNFQAVAIGWWK